MKVRNVVLVSFSDIGKNQRLLNYARAFNEIDGTFITIVGFDLSNIPLDITSKKSISIRYISMIPLRNYFLYILFFPIILIYYTLQMIGIVLSVNNVSFLLVTVHNLVLDVVVCYICSLIKKIKLVIDVDQLCISNEYTESRRRKALETSLLKKASIVVTGTRSKSLILQLRGINCHVLKPLPRRITPITSTIFQEKDLIIGIFTLNLDDNDINTVISLIKHIDAAEKHVHFHLFGSSKSTQYISEGLSKISLKKVDYRFLNINSKSHFNDLQKCLICFYPHNNPLLEISSIIMEIIGAGVPVIAKKNGSITEIIKDKETGFLYESEDKIANIVLKSLDDDNTIKMRSKILSLQNVILMDYKNFFTEFIR